MEVAGTLEAIQGADKKVLVISITIINNRNVYILFSAIEVFLMAG